LRIADKIFKADLLRAWEIH